MDCQRLYRALRGCLAGAWIGGVTAALAGGAPGAAWASDDSEFGSRGSVVHARLIAQIRAMAPPDRVRYLRPRAESGESAVILMILAREEARLSRLERDGEASERAEAHMADAARHGLAAYVAMRTAAPLCSDPTSPDEYLRELGVTLGPVLDWLGQQDTATRADVTQAAITLDLSTSKPARPDPMLCRRGRYGDRFCPPRPIWEPCPENTSPMMEFRASAILYAHQARMRRAARREVEALAR